MCAHKSKCYVQLYTYRVSFTLFDNEGVQLSLTIQKYLHTGPALHNVPIHVPLHNALPCGRAINARICYDTDSVFSVCIGLDIMVRLLYYHGFITFITDTPVLNVTFLCLFNL